jgi:hypothetical protein
LVKRGLEFDYVVETLRKTVLVDRTVQEERAVPASKDEADWVEDSLSKVRTANVGYDSSLHSDGKHIQ